MKKRIFIIKILRYIAIILLLLTSLVIAIKKWHLSLWLKCLTIIQLGRHSTLQNWMFPFLFYARLLAKYIVSKKYCFFKYKNKKQLNIFLLTYI